MYDTALLIHSWLRWAVLVFGLLAVARAVAGRSSRQWSRADDRIGALFTGMLDLQMLIGVIMYFAMSPITREAMRDMGAAMANSSLRFWAVEHPVGMLVGLALAHIGRARIRKATDAARKHRIALIFFTLALVVIALSIPWPGRAYGRPLLRF